MKRIDKEQLAAVSPWHWRIPRHGDMRVDAEVFASEAMLAALVKDDCLGQLVNVAALPGICAPALAMPDAHQGYGFPIGGVGAFDADEGVVSPGGVGYDINCGVRLLRSKLSRPDLDDKDLARLADAIAAGVPAGVGRGGDIRLKEKDLARVLAKGAAWAVSQGMGEAADLTNCEAAGCLDWADPEQVSPRALGRGRDQLGTMGAGNHFIEVAQVTTIYDPPAARAFGLVQDALVVWVHSGSRGLGHQVCDDYLKRFNSDKQALKPADRQLVSASPSSGCGAAYLGAMAGAANYAFANRQVLSHLVREAVMSALGLSPAAAGLGLVYDVAHNVAKFEEWAGKRLLVHRKGATRSLGPGRPEVPARYRAVGQPVLLPGDMGRGSYVLAGTKKAEELSFGSAAHGAGRAMSRKAAKAKAKGRDLAGELSGKGVLVRSSSFAGLAEEMPEAYKDASQVVEVLHQAGLAKKVAKTTPLVVVKG